MHRWIRRLHLLLTLAAGGLLAVVSLSGGIAAFRGELDRLYAAAPSGAPGTADLDAVAAALRQRWPGAEPGRLTSEGGVHVWSMRHDRGTPARDDDEAWMAFSDPADGRLLGDTRGRIGAALVAGVVRFHHDLWLPHSVGAVLVGSTGLCLLALCATGLWLWWPSRGRWRLAFAWRLRSHHRLRSGGRLAWYDLHRQLGLVTLPLLLLAGLTGAMLEFRWLLAAVHGGLGGSTADLPLKLRQRPPAPAGERPRPVTTAAPLHGWGVVARAAAAEGPLLAILPPRQGGRVWQAVVDVPGGTGALSGLVLRVDAGSGAVAERLDPRAMSPGGWLANQTWGLHVGSWGGLTSRILQSVAGLIPPFLLISGALLWWWRRPRPDRQDPA